MSESKKTHVLTTDYILTECGLCEAGTMFSESDLSPATWSWLQAANVLKSVDEIEQEADASATELDSDDEPEVAPQVQRPAGRSRR